MRKTKTTTTAGSTSSKDYYTDKGYEDKDLNIRGKPKRVLVSFQIEVRLWGEFDKYVQDEYGVYKKSYIIENLIRQFMKSKK